MMVVVGTAVSVVRNYIRPLHGRADRTVAATWVGPPPSSFHPVGGVVCGHEGRTLVIPLRPSGRRSAALELWLALFKKRSNPFLVVLGSGAPQMSLRLAIKHRSKVGVERRVYVRLHVSIADE